MAWTTPKTWTGSELLTASDLNQYVRDNLSTLYELVAAGGRKNLLDNGKMQIHQRGTSTSSITTVGYHTADRWIAGPGTCGTWTESIENDAPTGSGFRKSLKVYCSDKTGALDAAGDYMIIQQAIEGQNLQAIKKGTADAEQLTLSFWTKSNKTGTYVAELYDQDNTRHAHATYSVVQSGTWERQSVTFPADVTGAFDNDANGSLTVAFWLAAGTDYTSGTLATTWASATGANANRAVGQANLAAANANYWQVTGVQLEIGDTATGFEHLPYGDELATCQRYYYQHISGNNQVVGNGFYHDSADPSTGLYYTVTFPVTMRAAPVLVAVDGTNYWQASVGTLGDTFNAVGTISTWNGLNCCQLYASSGVSAAGSYGRACIIQSYNAAARMGFSADL